MLRIEDLPLLTGAGRFAAHELGVPAANIRVRHSRTDDIDHALGAFASRLTVMAGSATMLAARSLREKALQAAAQMLEADVLITTDAPSPRNPLGVKGAGEGGVTATGAAIAAAVDAAVGVPGGVWELPVRAEAVLALLRRAPGSANGDGGA